jgi:hypothetical protein
LTVAALALTGATARGGSAMGPGILVERPGGATFVTPQQIKGKADVPPRTYTLRARPGEAGQQDTHGGLSARRLIELVGLDPDGIGYLTVARADGTTLYLPGADFSDPPPFPEGPALVWIDADSTHFFRPLLDAEDSNAADNVATAGGEALVVGVHDGALLQVQAGGAPTDPAPGRSVAFSASAGGALPGEQLSFRWDFGDGSAAEGAQASHAFMATGTYDVTVAVSGDRESGGVSAPVPVVVGDPPERGGAGASKRFRVARPHGAGGSSGPRSGGGREQGGTGGGKPTRSHGGAAGSRAGARSVPSAATGESFSSEATGGEGSGPVGAGLPKAPRHRAARGRGSAPASGRRIVGGVLVLDPVAPMRAAGPHGSEPAGGSLSSQSAPREGGDPASLVVLLVASLLGLGAMLEWRGPRLRAR